MKIIIVREYTENGVRFVFRDVEDNGRRWTQYLVKEPWGEEFWNDCDPDAESDVLGARPYDSGQHELERAKGKRKSRQ